MRDIVNRRANVHTSDHVAAGKPNWSVFDAYVRQLEAIVGSYLGRPPNQPGFDAVDAALDGQPAAVARRSLTVELLRKNGAFFTGSRLARRAVTSLTHSISANSVIVDPTSGAGDLLIACSHACPILGDLSQTIELWGQLLTGRELQHAFISAARARLVLAAIRRGVPVASFSTAELKHAFPLLRPAPCFPTGNAWSRGPLISL